MLKTLSQDRMTVKISVENFTLIERTQVCGTQEEKYLVQGNTRDRRPVVQLQVASWVNKRGLKHAKLSLQLSSITFTLPSDTSLLDELVALSQAPPGAFLDVVPTDTTTIDFESSHITIRLVARTLHHALAIYSDRVSFRTTLKNKATVTKCRGNAVNIQGWIAESPRDAGSFYVGLKVSSIRYATGELPNPIRHHRI